MTTFTLLVILFFGWDIGWLLMGVRPLFPWQLRKMMAEPQNKPVLIDVRTQPEYRMFHIEGAGNHPEVLVRPEDFLPDSPEQPVVLICMTGHRSPLAAWQLKKKGVQKVHNLTWGMLAWKLFFGHTVSSDSP